MGQQQLLLVILVTIIVGVATVVAIDTMQQTRHNANESAIRQDILSILTDARQYYQKPTALGGGGQSFDDISDEHILTVEPSNENASYNLSGSGKTVTVTGDSKSTEIIFTATAEMSSGEMDISWSKSTD